MINQLHVVEKIGVASGGEGLAALRYAQSISCQSINVVLLSRFFCNREIVSDSLFFSNLLINGNRSFMNWFNEYKFLSMLCDRKKINVIHIHGMWSILLTIAALVAYKRGIPLIVSPHGCLEPWALGHKYFKKLFAMKTYQGFSLRKASLLVASSNQELVNLRSLSIRQPIAVIPNGVDIPANFSPSVTVSRKTFLFLSRIHPKKGLLDLVDAWALVRRPGWRILIAGGDEEGYKAKVESLMRQRGVESDFEFSGFVDGDQKHACFLNADTFILPTYSENFGIAVAEALSYSLPVITTTGTPWSDLLKYNCGWWVAPGVIGISGALVEAMNCDPYELRMMGQRGRQLVSSKYTWDQIGISARQITEWVIDQSRPKPISINFYN